MRDDRTNFGSHRNDALHQLGSRSKSFQLNLYIYCLVKPLQYNYTLLESSTIFTGNTVDES